MSTPAIIVRDAAELVTAVDELLSTTTIDAVLSLVEALGGAEVIATGVSFLEDQLGTISTGLAHLRDPLLHVGALAGTTALLGSLMEGLSLLVSTPGEQLAEVGIEQALAVTEPVSAAVGYGGDVLRGTESVLLGLPQVEDLDLLDASLRRLAVTLAEYRLAVQGGPDA